MNVRSYSVTGLVVVAAVALVVAVLVVSRVLRSDAGAGTAAQVSPPTPDVEAPVRGELKRPDDVAGRRETRVAPPQPGQGAKETVARLDGFVVEVAYSDGRPAGGTTVVLYDSDQVLAHATVDAKGHARLDPYDRLVDLIVLKGSAVQHVATGLHAGPGRHRIVIPGRFRVSGVVRVHGEVPEEPLALWLRSADESGGIVDPPPVVAAFFDWRGFQGRPRMWEWTDDSGSFCFQGLRSTWQGRISAPAGYRLENGESDIVLSGPQENLVLDLVREPLLTGRIVDPIRLEPVMGAAVRYDVSCPTGSESQQSTTGADGRFDIPLRCGESYSVDIEASKEGLGFGRWSFEDMTRPAWGEQQDLGDLPLEETREVGFLVRDTAGKPIAGAIVRPEGIETLASAPTDAEGRIALQILKECSFVQVDALGHGPSIVVPTGRIVDVTLEPGSNILVECPGIEGDDAPPASLSVSAEERVFQADDGSTPDPIQLELGATAFRSARIRTLGGGQVSVHLELALPPSGRVLLTNLRPNALLTIRAFTTAGEPCGDATVIAPAAGWRTVTID